LSIGVLGPVVITDRDGHAVPIAGRKARALLALLAIRPNQVVSTELLEDELWCGVPPAGARATLHAHISRLRAVLRAAGGTAELATNACGYRLSVAPDELDSTRFEMLARAGAEAAASSPDTAVSRLARSLEEWRGPALQELHDFEPLFLEAQRLEELRLVAVEERWSAELRLGGHLLAVGQLQRLVVDHPFRERLQGLFMLALHRSGRQTEALRAYQVAVDALAEIGLAPGAELRLLEQQIAAQDDALDHALVWSAVAVGSPQSRRSHSEISLVQDDHAAKAHAALDTAIEQFTRAGDDALARLCYHDAVCHYRLALSMLDLCHPDQRRRRTELLLACGRACHVAYELTDALTMFRLAARSAVSIGDIALLNEAACGLAFATEFAMADTETVELLAHALRTVPSDSPRRVELLAGLARTMPQDDRRSRAHASTAVALARRLGDPRALTIALATSVLVTWGPDDTHARLAMIDEVIALADELAWIDIVIEARNWKAATLLQLGRTADAEADTAAVHDWARTSGRPFFVALAAMRQVGTLLAHGRLADAEDALSNPPAAAHASPNFSEAAAAQLFLLRLAQGRLGELLAVIESFLDAGQAPFAWRAAHVLALVQTGDERSVDALRTQVTAMRMAPRNWLWLTAVALLADACVAIGDRDCAPALERALRDHEQQIVVVAHGIATLGAVAPRIDALRALIPRVPDRKEVASAP
jgi:DNA-binding SARP family transcriptional activator